MNILKTIMLGISLCWLWQTASGQVGNRLSPDLKSVVDSLISTQMQRQHIVGLSAALICRGELVYVGGYGYANREEKVPAEPGTFYRLASLSKTITATAVLHAASEGLIDLKADIRQYVPEFPDKGLGPVTIEQLLACEGGLQHYEQTAPLNRDTLLRYVNDHPDRYDPIAALQIFKDQPLIAAPGTRFNYSTFSFNLLAAALERATGTSYVDYVREQIGVKANLPYLQPEFRHLSPYPQQASWYRVESDRAVVDTGSTVDYRDVSWKLGGGGYIGTVLDMAGFAQALLNGTYLDSVSLARMFTMRRLADKPTYYGLGVFLNKRNGRLYGSQFGNQVGARTMLYMSPDSMNAVVLLSNTYGTDLLPLAQQLMDRLQFSKIRDTLLYPLLINELAQVRWSEEEPGVPSHPGWLYWDQVPGAESYEIQWSEYPDFSAVSRSVVRRDRSYQLPEWGGGKHLFCRIRALNEYRLIPQYGPWSAILDRSAGDTQAP